MGGPKQKGVTTYRTSLLSPTLILSPTDMIRYDTHNLPPNPVVSPFQQRALAGMFHGYLFNGYKRLVAQAPYFFVPLAFGSSAPFSPGDPRCIALY